MPGRVLIVDDDRDGCRLLEGFLSGAGCETEVRFDGPAALARFREKPFDVVVTDVRMPGMDGLDLLRTLKTIDPDVGVIIVSAVLEDRTRLAIEALRGGADDYFPKPVEDLGELERAVGRALGRRLSRRAQAIQILELEQLARSDSLTGLANRLELEQRLREEFSRLDRGAEELALAMFDVDEFKAINDTGGHLVGDQVLRAVGLAVRENCRAYDIKARYGGDEFVVVMPDTNLEQGVGVAEKIRREVASLVFRTGRGPLGVTLSAGVTSTGPAEAITPAGLIRRADDALYRAKSAGRNRTISLNQGKPGAEVLLIGEDESEAEAILRMCELLGVHADRAASAAEGIERVRLARYGLVIVDLDLPDLAGSEAIARIREAAPGTTAALVTGEADAGPRLAEAMASARASLARKPLSIDRLKALLSEARRRS